MKLHPALALGLKLAGSIWFLALAARFFLQGDPFMGLLVGAAGAAMLVLAGEDFVGRRRPK